MSLFILYCFSRCSMIFVLPVLLHVFIHFFMSFLMSSFFFETCVAGGGHNTCSRPLPRLPCYFNQGRSCWRRAIQQSTFNALIIAAKKTIMTTTTTCSTTSSADNDVTSTTSSSRSVLDDDDDDNDDGASLPSRLCLP